ncbi:MAG: EcsC family protein [Gloeobacterales cyanobacterium]
MPILPGSMKKELTTGVYKAPSKAMSWVGSLSEFLGDTVSKTKENWLSRLLTKYLGANWLLDLLNKVDIHKARNRVAKLQRAYPQETPAQISQRLIWSKAKYIGGIGFASGLVPPGLNVPFIVLDVITTVVIQMELVYEIAAAHGLDLEAQERKGELVLVMAIGAGSDRAVTAGLRVFEQKVTPVLLEQLAKVVGGKLAEKFVTRSIPLIGAALGAGANITFLYLLGKTAVQFYSNKGLVLEEATVTLDVHKR